MRTPPLRTPTTVNALLSEIADVGRDPRRGGYSRHVFDAAERELREWFAAHARRLGLDLDVDRNGNTWAWWGAPGANSTVTGSHLDSVPGGGELDGPLGVASAIAAIDSLQSSGWRPTRPMAIAVFAEEEGARFGSACLGSRLMAGQIDPSAAAALADAAGVTFGAAGRDMGLDPAHFGEDRETLDRVGTFVELHVEQGKSLAAGARPVGVASSILAHGRWRLDVRGQGNHAGATRMRDRADPVVVAARIALIARDAARSRDRHRPARATVGRLEPVPGGTNVIASRVNLWLDVRGDDDSAARSLVDEIAAAAQDAAQEEGCSVDVVEESYSGRVDFDEGLRERLSRLLGDAPIIPTGAGHDAGVLASFAPTAMLFVRNPTGISHSPEETADPSDRDAGVLALAEVLRDVDQAV